MGSSPNLEWMKKELAKKRKTLLLAVKIAVGSSAAIYIAQMLGLEYAISAGTITLLTLLTTKWETVRLSAFRLVTFAVTIPLAWASFAHIKSMWIGYGVFIFCVVLFAEVMGWRATISVNSVIGAHLLTSRDFGMSFVENEFLLVLIGVVIAFLLNLFQNNDRNEKDIIANMRYTEERLQQILRRFAQYLSQEEIPGAADRGENMGTAGSALQVGQEQTAADSGSRGKSGRAALCLPAICGMISSCWRRSCRASFWKHMNIRKIHSIPTQFITSITLKCAPTSAMCSTTCTMR